MRLVPPSNCFHLISSLPDPSCIGRNTSAIFGAGPSFGLTPAETRPQFRPAPIKKAPEPRKIKRSQSDVALRKRPNLRRKSGDFSQVRKRSESETGHQNGSICNGDTESKPPVSSRSESTDTADLACPLSEQGDHSNRYPLFIQVNSAAQAQNKARVAKPVGKPSNQGAAKQEVNQGPAKQEVRKKRSASLTTQKRLIESKQQSSTSKPAQYIVKDGNIRREKSDLVKINRTQSPSSVTAIPRPARSNSSTSLKENNNIGNPRSRSPAGLQREISDVSKRRVQPEFHREKSDVARPRAQSRTNSPIETEGGISRSYSNRSLTSNSLGKSPSISSIEESRSRAGSGSEMSKIPSLARTPTQTDSQVSNIPSLVKHQVSDDRTPPKSKIPSINKGDKGHDLIRKSSIPTSSRKESASQKDKQPPSKITNSAKENKNPSAATNGHESSKQISKIPSFSKSTTLKSKVPSVARKDSQHEQPPMQNGTTEEQSSSKSKIPGAASTPQGTGIPSGISRIPSFAKSTPKQKEAVPNKSRISGSTNKTNESKLPSPGGSKISETGGVPVNQSRISFLPQNKAIESRVPTPGEHRDSIKATPSSLPVAVKTSGIPKPGEPAQGSGAPGSADFETGIQRAVSAPVESKNKIPKLTTTKPAVSNGNEEGSAEKKRGISTFGGRQPYMEKEPSNSEEGPATPPTTPIKRGAAESPLDKYIFSEAKKMEQLLRNEPLEVEVIDKGDLGEDEDFLRQENKIEKLGEKEKDKELGLLHSKEAEDLISEVLKSYAPDINNENQSELHNIKLVTEKDDNKNIKEKINIDDIVLQPVNSAELEEPQVREPLLAKQHLEFEETTSSPKEKDVKETIKDDIAEKSKEKVKTPGGKADLPGLKIIMPPENEDGRKKSAGEEITNKDETKSEGPGIDSLGEYAQQARRSRSRQRKIVSPDSEEAEKEFVPVLEQDKVGQSQQKEKTIAKEPEIDQLKKDIDKDKFGTVPFLSESEKKPKEGMKATKTKSKNDKPKFVIESSLGKDFYSSRKSNESVESRESVHDDVGKSSFRPEFSALVFENKVAKEPAASSTSEAQSGENKEAQFVDVDLNAEPAIVKQRRELSKSVDDLDEKTVKCMCGRGGKCSIM